MTVAYEPATDPYEFAVRQAIEDRRDRRLDCRRRVGSGGPCSLCGALLSDQPDALNRHALWHLHSEERLERVERIVAPPS